LQQNLKFQPDWYLLTASKPLPTLIKPPRTGSNDLEIIPFERNILGQYNNANILAATCLSYELGIKKGPIMQAIKSFTGIQRRLEIKYRNKEKMIIDDFGSSPAKAEAALRSLKAELPEYRIVAIIEPNAGNRSLTALGLFDKALQPADVLVIPKFTVLPKSSQERYTEEDFQEKLSETKLKVSYCPMDTDLVHYLSQEYATHKKIIIVFLGSHSFRGMIPKLIEMVKHGKEA
jgi:UDP-N-acetylmuramate--alanine ligase